MSEETEELRPNEAFGDSYYELAPQESITILFDDQSLAPCRGEEGGGISFFQALLLTLSVISSVVLISSLVWYTARKRARMKMTHHLVPLYHFDIGECEDWENEFLEDTKRGRARSRPQYYRSVNPPVTTIMTTSQ